jgi:NitT/TauT family transport system ATP-binding protein
MIAFEKVAKTFSQNRCTPRRVLSGLDFVIEEGQFICVVGPSGCGKTTLLNLIAGFISPSEGRILFEGEPIRAPGPDRAVVFQDANLFPWLDVAKNVVFGLKLQGMKGRSLFETSMKYLESMGLAEHAKQYPHALSGGMRQRVAIARVLALEPRVLLMDEPFSALDANTRERLQDELLGVWKVRRRTVVYVTHSVDEAAYLADRIMVLGNGVSGVFADMRLDIERPRDRATSEFLSLKKQLRDCLAALPCCIQPMDCEN